ncbi:Uncharacterised protein [Bordetella pertussis]|nr:Uncharacterised protein [Bordetella pertussis]CFU00067.1 Uncharacterised protein [Bordetella pertussis]
MRARNQGSQAAAMASRCAKRCASSASLAPVRASMAATASARPHVRTRLCHCPFEMAATMTRFPSRVTKSLPKAP